MNKRLIFLIVILIIIGSAVLYVLKLIESPHGPQSLPYSPTPTPLSISADQVKSSMKIVSIDPRNQQDSVSVNQIVKAEFSQPTQGVSFAIYPDAPFALTAQAKEVTIKFSQPLTSNTVYSYSFLDAEGKVISSGQFTTGLTADSIAPLSKSYDNLDTTADVAQRENYPDVFLATYTPFDSGTFSVLSDFSNANDGHFFFTVTQKGNNAKKDFLSWLNSLGLTSQQIQKLDIRYQ